MGAVGTRPAGWGRAAGIGLLSLLLAVSAAAPVGASTAPPRSGPAALPAVDVQRPALVLTRAGHSDLRVAISSVGIDDPWRFKIERAARGSWERLRSYRTIDGARTVPVGRGLFRVYVYAQHGHRGVWSEPVSMVGSRPPTLQVSTVSEVPAISVRVSPRVPGPAHWQFTLQRKQPDGWQDLSSHRTAGRRETRTVPVSPGHYRVLLDAAEYGHTDLASGRRTVTLGTPGLSLRPTDRGLWVQVTAEGIDGVAWQVRVHGRAGHAVSEVGEFTTDTAGRLSLTLPEGEYRVAVPGWQHGGYGSAAKSRYTASGRETTETAFRRLVGRSTKGRPIYAYFRGDPDSEHQVVLLGQIHGNEPVGRWVADYTRRRLAPLPGTGLWIIPTMNPDGSATGSRTNARGVDLNRNWPSSDWRLRPRGYTYSGPSPGSEPEVQAMIRFVESVEPDYVATVHQPWGLIFSSTEDLHFERRLSHYLDLPIDPPGYGIDAPGVNLPTLAGWHREHHADAGVAITVELPGSPVEWGDQKRYARGLLKAMLVR